MFVSQCIWKFWKLAWVIEMQLFVQQIYSRIKILLRRFAINKSEEIFYLRELEEASIKHIYPAVKTEYILCFWCASFGYLVTYPEEGNTTIPSMESCWYVFRIQFTNLKIYKVKNNLLFQWWNINHKIISGDRSTGVVFKY